MTSLLFDKYLQANRKFFARRLAPIAADAGSLYVEPAVSDEVALNAVLRIAAAIAEIKNLRPLVMATRFGCGNERRIIRSFAISRMASTFGTMISGCLSHPAGLWRCFRHIVTGHRLVRLTIGSHPVGKHIYDHLLRRHGLPSLAVLSLRIRCEAAVELAYYFGLKRLLDRTRCCFAILGDNTYRQGISFELLKRHAIPSLCSIDLNGMSAHLYRTGQDYEDHCRTPDSDIVRMLNADPVVAVAASEALDARTAGREMQHDLIRAYSAAKRSPAGEELRKEMGAVEGKKMVLVMAHIFQDAPHAYPGTLFHDYREWLMATCRRLALNRNVVLIVKEHPSIELYQEHGTIDRVLAELGPERVRIVKDINTRSFFDSADAVVTCGGTCGMEFPCFGVPVVVAARPPYSGFSYITRPSTREQYYSVLDNIVEIPRLSEQQIRLARTVFYVLQAVQRVDKRQLGLGTQGLTLGKPSDPDKAWREMLAELATGEGQRRLVTYLAETFDFGLLNLVERSILSRHRPDVQHQRATEDEVLVW